MPFEPDAAHLFFQLVSRRYERGAMLVPSNRAVSEWGTAFGDDVVATAILNRLLHHSDVITIRGDSYRLRRSTAAASRPNYLDGAVSLFKLLDRIEDAKAAVWIGCLYAEGEIEVLMTLRAAWRSGEDKCPGEAAHSGRTRPGLTPYVGVVSAAPATQRRNGSARRA